MWTVAIVNTLEESNKDTERVGLAESSVKNRTLGKERGGVVTRCQKTCQEVKDGQNQMQLKLGQLIVRQRQHEVGEGLLSEVPYGVACSKKEP